jgi:hypothetical protein
MGRRGRILGTVAVALVAVGLATPAAADPIPPFDLDPVKLERAWTHAWRTLSESRRS